MEEENESSQNRLLDLPLELYIKVFSCLPLRDIAVLPLVSKEWKAMASDRFLWAALLERTFPLLASVSKKLGIHPKDQLIAQANMKANRVQESKCLWFEGRRPFPISFLALSSDGRLAATLTFGEPEAVPRIWDLETKRQLYHLKIPMEYNWDVIFSPNSKLIATGSNDHKTRLWDVEKGNFLYALEGHKPTVKTVAFSPDSKLIATSPDGHTVHLWEVEAGTYKSILEGHEAGIKSVEFSPDGKFVVTISSDCTARLWEVESGRCKHIFQSPQESVIKVAFSPDNQLLATGILGRGRRLSVKLWDLPSVESQRLLGENTDNFSGHENSKFKFSLDGKWIAVGRYGDGDSWKTFDYDSKKVCLYDVESGKRVHTLKGGHKNSISDFDFSPNGKWIATCSDKKTICLWEIETGILLSTLKTGNRSLFSVKFSPNGGHLFANSQIFDFFPAKKDSFQPEEMIEDRLSEEQAGNLTKRAVTEKFKKRKSRSGRNQQDGNHNLTEVEHALPSPQKKKKKEE
nr:F-box/WD40 repeat-containing protein [Parachlamydia sp. AcF125]